MAGANEVILMREGGGQYRIAITLHGGSSDRYDLTIHNEMSGWEREAGIEAYMHDQHVIENLSARGLESIRTLIGFLIDSLGVLHFIDEEMTTNIHEGVPVPWPELPTAGDAQ